MTIRVLFLCVGNSARSQMAEGLLRQLGGGRFEAFSAGTDPRPHVHPMAVRVMADQGIDLRSGVPKGLEAYAGQSFDWAISVCEKAREICPEWPAALTALWSFPDPIAAREEDQPRVFRETAQGLKRRIDLFILTDRGDAMAPTRARPLGEPSPSSTGAAQLDAGPRLRARSWGPVRLALGCAQIAAATTSAALLIEAGVTRATLAAVIATSVATTVSVMLFGRDRPRGLG